MRDSGFIAQHRGGPLKLCRHRPLARWAANCAQHVMHHFTHVSDDQRPLHALELGGARALG